ncbi:MAG: hypothetical protein N3H84_06605, partial [Candidatus Caldarchaeum sp.]|nr:hypothetical protein [Candidatus Caldarchaeum sp.]
YLEFPVDPERVFVQGLATSVEVNQTHVFVAGHYWTHRLGALAVFVAVFTKSDCSLTGLYTFDVTDFEEVSLVTIFTGEGIDLAVDQTGVYLLVGYFVFENLELLVLKLDHHLQYLSHRFYNLTAGRDFGASIALGDRSVYVAGLTEYRVNSMLDGQRVFVLELDKSDLLVRNTTLLQPIEEYYLGLEIIVDENNDIYVVQTFQKNMASNAIVVSKFDRMMNNLWTQTYWLFHPYTDTNPDTEPQHVVERFAYAVSAAVSSKYLFVGGFTTNTYFGDGQEPLIPHGLLLTIDRANGEGLLAFKIQAQPSPSYPVQLFGVDAYLDCAYLAGASSYYRLEYVFLNNFNLILPTWSQRGTATLLDQVLEERDDEPSLNSWNPVFDINIDDQSYAFYGIFCPGALILETTTTTTSTVQVTSTTATTTKRTTTTTRYTTSTATTTNTITSFSTETQYVTEYTYSTSYTTRLVELATTAYTTVTERTAIGVTETVSVASTTMVQFIKTFTFDGPRAVPAVGLTSTVLANRTTTVVSTTTLAGEVDWTALPPWFYLPFFLLPIPFAAVLMSRGRHRIVINKVNAPPFGWKPGDNPVFEDAFAKPCILNIKRNTVVEFVNEDDVPHLIASYQAPGEHHFESDEIKPGKKWKHKFTEPGIYYVKSLTKQYVGAVIRVGR